MVSKVEAAAIQQKAGHILIGGAVQQRVALRVPHAVQIGAPHHPAAQLQGMLLGGGIAAVGNGGQVVLPQHARRARTVE